MSRFRGALLLALAIATICSPSPTALSSAAPPPEVEYAGCEGLLIPGPVCVLKPDRTLQLWVGAPPDAGVEIQVDGKTVDAPAESIQNGQGFSLTLPSGARRLDVVLAAREDQEPWSLWLAESTPVRNARMFRDVQREIEERTLDAYYRIRERDLAAARKTLSTLPLPPRLAAESRINLSFNRGLLADREGDYRSALTETQKVIEIAERVQMAEERWKAEQQMALLLRGLGRSREAAHIFERLGRTMPPMAPCKVAQFLNNRAWSVLLAREAGERLEDPTPLLEKALALYEDCQRDRLGKKVGALINLTLAHLQEGRPSQAKDLLARVHRIEPLTSLPNTLWRLDLEARIELLEKQLPQALHRFEELEELAEETSSPDGRLRAAYGQAQAHQGLGDPEAALEALRGAEALLDEQSLQIPVHQGRETFAATRQAAVGLHLEILLDRGRNEEALAVMRHARSRMLRQLERSDRLASLPPRQREQWQTYLSAYQTKRTELEDRAKDDWRLPADQLSREWAARKTEAEAAQRLLDQAFLLLGDGEPTEERLAPPRPGELILAYHPLAHGWAAFAASGETVEVHRFELPPQPEKADRQRLARELLLPFRDEIKAARKIRLLPSGPLQEVDFHALPFDGDVLLASAPVVYGLDLPVPVDPAPSRGRHALLVADARGDLPGALQESRKISRVLESGPRSWITEELTGANASAQAVRDRLTAADLLHYAGHSSYSGFGGWESGLLLAEDTRLTLGDFLALERVPAWVVLSGCESGRSSSESPVESLGLAHAFLLAGSQAVVASTRPAFDLSVPDLFAELYRQWDGEDLALAFQRAQLSWRKRNPRADWAGFRLFEP